MIKDYIHVQLKSISYFLKGQKPTRFRVNENKSRGYSVSYTDGGKSGEGFIVLNKGKKVSYFPNYNRRGTTRTLDYVPFKQMFGLMKTGIHNGSEGSFPSTQFLPPLGNTYTNFKNFAFQRGSMLCRPWSVGTSKMQS